MSYLESQQRIQEAEAALKVGDEVHARELFREAARLQRAFVDALPADRTRTKSVYGLSVATLLYRAGDLDEAERLAHGFLTQNWIEPYSANQLRELLSRIWSDRGEPSRSASQAQALEPEVASKPSSKLRAPRRRRSVPKLPPMGTGSRLGIPLGVYP